MEYSSSQGVPIASAPPIATSSVGVPIGISPIPAFPATTVPLYPPLPSGYAHREDKHGTAPPPCYADAMIYPTRYIQPYQPQHMDENEVRAAVARHVSGKVLYSSAAVQQMTYTNIDMNVAYVYRLQTFTEKRETKWISKAHDPSYPVDGTHNGPIPGPWDVSVVAPEEFKADTRKIIVPHSEHLQQCHRCLGRGNVQCKNCNGVGYKSCTWCKGVGYRMSHDGNRACSSCNSTGRDGCSSCSQRGHKKCDLCQAHGTLKYSIQLKVTWSVQDDYFFSNSCGLKEKLLKEACGTKILHEEDRIVYPIAPQEFIDQSIVSSSKTLVDKHKGQTYDQAIIRQRHTLTAVPIAVVNYTRKGTPGSFFVYGESNDRKAHFDNYPSKNCVIS